ncbi:hypothetical protein Tco_0212870 [Tanacetum coccineum]
MQSSLSSDVTIKEATFKYFLFFVYDVLKIKPYYKAFKITVQMLPGDLYAGILGLRKHIIGLEQFRDILQICPRVGNKKFVEPPLEKEILIFLASLWTFLGYMWRHTDLIVNKLHQPVEIILLLNQQMSQRDDDQEMMSKIKMMKIARNMTFMRLTQVKKEMHDDHRAMIEMIKKMKRVHIDDVKKSED